MLRLGLAVVTRADQTPAPPRFDDARLLWKVELAHELAKARARADFLGTVRR